MKKTQKIKKKVQAIQTQKWRTLKIPTDVMDKMGRESQTVWNTDNEDARKELMVGELKKKGRLFKKVSHLIKEGKKIKEG